MCYSHEAPAPGKATAYVAMALDPLSISQDLRAAGFTEEQANLLATHIASRSHDLVTTQDLRLAVSELLLKLGTGMVVGFGFVLTAIGIGVGVIVNQLA